MIRGLLPVSLLVPLHWFRWSRQRCLNPKQRFESEAKQRGQRQNEPPNNPIQIHSNHLGTEPQKYGRVDCDPGNKKHSFFRNRRTNPGSALIPAEWPVQLKSMQLVRQGSQAQL